MVANSHESRDQSISLFAQARQTHFQRSSFINRFSFLFVLLLRRATQSLLTLGDKTEGEETARLGQTDAIGKIAMWQCSVPPYLLLATAWERQTGDDYSQRTVCEKHGLYPAPTPATRSFGQFFRFSRVTARAKCCIELGLFPQPTFSVVRKGR